MARIRKNLDRYAILMGFDYGERHIGVAIGNTLTCLARSLTIIRNLNRFYRFNSINNLLDEWHPDILVVGLPMHFDGRAHKMTNLARRFGNQLNGRFKLPVNWSDERYTSSEAKSNIKKSINRIPFSRKMLDGDAACIILQQYLNQENLNQGNLI